MNKMKSNNINFVTVFDTVLLDLPSRSRDIVAKRFGIGEEKPLTLQAIGDEYDITRERVRQIVQSGLKNVDTSDDRDDFSQAKKAIMTHIDENDGIASIDDVAKSLGGNDVDEHGAIRFFLDGMDDIVVVNAKKYPVDERVIALADFDINNWVETHDEIKGILENKQKTYTVKKLQEKIADDIERESIERFLQVSSEIGKNPFDKWGMYGWDDISPRGVREKALLIMKEGQKPMHFRDIAQSIDDYGLGKKGKKSHPQTVHNELIRDDNFVLVGRGVYTLSADGHVEGTVRDVIENVLEKSDEPLTAEEVIERVLEMRHVQPSTVKVNLNAIAKKLNKKYTLDTDAS